MAEKPGWSSPTHAEMQEFYGKRKCAPSLIELRNAIRREIPDERDAAHMYADMAAKFTHFGEATNAEMLRLISGQEALHQAILEFIVDDISMRCGE